MYLERRFNIIPVKVCAIAVTKWNDINWQFPFHSRTQIHVSFSLWLIDETSVGPVVKSSSTHQTTEISSVSLMQLATQNRFQYKSPNEYDT
jgi:hypothetical protein